MKNENFAQFADVPSAFVESSNRLNSLRTVQTTLTNEQFADMGLILLEQKSSTSNFNQYFGFGKNLQSEHPVLFASSTYSSLLRKKSILKIQKPKWFTLFLERMDELDKAAIEDEITVSNKSRVEVSTFASSLRDARVPTVFLVANGNVRLRWSNNQGEKVGLQFRGNGEVQYLFFKREDKNMEQMLGVKQVSTIESFITTCGLRHVIAE